MVYEVAKKSVKKHTPSDYRALIRKLKTINDSQLIELINEARGLPDPYFVSLALFAISDHPHLELNKAVETAKEAIEQTKKVQRLWRRAEILSELVKKSKSWRKDEGTNTEQYENELLDDIQAIVIAMDHGQGLSDAVIGCSPYFGCNRLKTLLDRAIKNEGFVAEDTKVVIKQLLKQCSFSKLLVDQITSTIRTIDDAFVRAKLFGYLHLQANNLGRIIEANSALKLAIETANNVDDNQRLELFRYLTQNVTNKEELEILYNALSYLDDPENKARFLATLAGSADKAGSAELAYQWLTEGVELSDQIGDSKTMASIKLNLALGFEKLGESEMANQNFQAALDLCGENNTLRARILKAMGLVDEKELTKQPHDSQKFKVNNNKKADISDNHSQDKITKRGTPNHVLAIYDTYEGGLKPIHFRTVARAAPLCYAFNLDLFLLGFPTKDLDHFIDQVKTETNIGKSGYYLKQMAANKRISLVHCTQNEQPTNWNEIGLPVATTSHPDNIKRIGLKEAIQKASSDHPLKRLCLIMGLGRHGLPKALLKSVNYHLELTGNNVPLETCTAMGVIAQMLSAEENDN